MNCKVCNDEFESSFGYDEEHCDEFCARVTDPSVEGIQIRQLRKFDEEPRQSWFTSYMNAFKKRARGEQAEVIEERILNSDEYIRLKLRFQKDEHTQPELRKVKI